MLNSIDIQHRQNCSSSARKIIAECGQKQVGKLTVQVADYLWLRTISVIRTKLHTRWHLYFRPQYTNQQCSYPTASDEKQRSPPTGLLSDVLSTQSKSCVSLTMFLNKC